MAPRTVIFQDIPKTSKVHSNRESPSLGKSLLKEMVSEFSRTECLHSILFILFLCLKNGVSSKDRVTSSIKTYVDTSLGGIMSRITFLESKCDSIVELIQELHKPCDGRGVGIANFKGVNEMQEQNMPILEDEVKFETSFHICAKLQSREIDLSTPPDDFLSRKRKWHKVSDEDYGPRFALITPRPPDFSIIFL
ncbi:hypothetical protein P3L10_028221 [Capsicum annuum]